MLKFRKKPSAVDNMETYKSEILRSGKHRVILIDASALEGESSRERAFSARKQCAEMGYGILSNIALDSKHSDWINGPVTIVALV